MSELVEEFLEDYLKRVPYLPDTNPEDMPRLTTKQDLINMLASVELMLRWNKGKPIEDTIDLIIRESVDKFETTRKKYATPGYTANVKVGNINVKLYGGNINYQGEPMQEDALFDIASMTKLYTQIIAYNLINKGYFKRSDKISDLDDRFVNIGDVTIDDIMTFGVDLRTDGRIDSKSTIKDCLDILYHTYSVETGIYRYADVGMMVLKEVMEHVTKKTYQDLLNEYIVIPLGLEDTHVIVPNSKFHLVTGTPNANTGNVNDMMANAVGGYSGHAGIISSNDDVVKVMEEVTKKEGNRILPDNSDFTKVNPHLNVKGNPVARAIPGNVYIPGKDGIYSGFIDTVDPIDSIGTAGSTRTNAIASSDSVSTLLFNTAGMSTETANEMVDELNKEKIKNGKSPINPIREYTFDRDGKMIKRELHDVREIFPVGPMARAVQSLSYTTVKLRFLDFLMRKQEMNLEVNYNKNIR